jgi:hypothetical protein
MIFYWENKINKQNGSPGIIVKPQTSFFAAYHLGSVAINMDEFFASKKHLVFYLIESDI